MLPSSDVKRTKYILVFTQNLRSDFFLHIYKKKLRYLQKSWHILLRVDFLSIYFNNELSALEFDFWLLEFFFIAITRDDISVICDTQNRALNHASVTNVVWMPVCSHEVLQSLQMYLMAVPSYRFYCRLCTTLILPLTYKRKLTLVLLVLLGSPWLFTKGNEDVVHSIRLDTKLEGTIICMQSTPAEKPVGWKVIHKCFEHFW